MEASHFNLEQAGPHFLPGWHPFLGREPQTKLGTPPFPIGAPSALFPFCSAHIHAQLRLPARAGAPYTAGMVPRLVPSPCRRSSPEPTTPKALR
jgi:hypothetical protein